MKIIPEVTRIEVIDDRGRAYTNYDVDNAELVWQDDGKTLKIFVWSLHDDTVPPPPPLKSNDDLGEYFGVDTWKTKNRLRGVFKHGPLRRRYGMNDEDWPQGPE